MNEDNKNISAYNYIAVEGNIGAGKTTLCKMLAADYNSKLVLEQFSDNPFLPMFYKEPDRYGFTVELFFMSERYQQLQKSLVEQDLFKKNTIADYFFIKTLLFANKTLSGEEYRLFQRFFNILNSNFPKPDLLVYLYRPIKDLLHNIKKRGREYEQEISEEYLQNIQNAYLDYFKVEQEIPILIIDVKDFNFVEEAGYYEQIKSFLHQEYEVGVHKVHLERLVGKEE